MQVSPELGNEKDQSNHDLSAKSVGAENAPQTTQGVDAAPVPPSSREALMEGLPPTLPGGPFSAKFQSCRFSSQPACRMSVGVGDLRRLPLAWIMDPEPQRRDSSDRRDFGQ